VAEQTKAHAVCLVPPGFISEIAVHQARARARCAVLLQIMVGTGLDVQRARASAARRALAPPTCPALDAWQLLLRLRHRAEWT
jgi:hypothetical protein